MYCGFLSPLHTGVRFPTASPGSLGLSFRQFRGVVRAEQALARAKVSPKPWEWETSHEIGCCYPVGARP